MQEKCVAQYKMGGKNPKSVWRNDEVKAAVRRKEVVWELEMKRQKKDV